MHPGHLCLPGEVRCHLLTALTDVTQEGGFADVSEGELWVKGQRGLEYRHLFDFVAIQGLQLFYVPPGSTRIEAIRPSQY